MRFTRPQRKSKGRPSCHGIWPCFASWIPAWGIWNALVSSLLADITGYSFFHRLFLPIRWTLTSSPRGRSGCESSTSRRRRSGFELSTSPTFVGALPSCWSYHWRTTVESIHRLDGVTLQGLGDLEQFCRDLRYASMSHQTYANIRSFWSERSDLSRHYSVLRIHGAGPGEKRVSDLEGDPSLVLVDDRVPLERVHVESVASCHQRWSSEGFGMSTLSWPIPTSWRALRSAWLREEIAWLLGWDWWHPSLRVYPGGVAELAVEALCCCAVCCGLMRMFDCCFVLPVILSWVINTLDIKSRSNSIKSLGLLAGNRPHEQNLLSL